MLVGWRAARTLLSHSVRFRCSDIRWFVRWPKAVFTGRFGRHDGHFDPGQRIANLVMIGLLLALIVSGVGLWGVSGGPAFVWFNRIHRWSTYLFTPVIIGHVLIAAGVVPGYRGIWRAMQLGGRLRPRDAARVWPTWLDHATTAAVGQEHGPPTSAEPGRTVHTRQRLRRRRTRRHLGLSGCFPYISAVGTWVPPHGLLHSMQLLGICGSRRENSLNRAALDVVDKIAHDRGHELVPSVPLDRLPYFSSDLEQSALPAVVGRLRNQVAGVNAIVIAAPEYARGMSGMLKNALEWLVGSIDLPGMPVGLINVSPGYRGAERAQAWTVETLQAMSVRLVEPQVCIGSATVKYNGHVLTDQGCIEVIGKLVHALTVASSAPSL